MTRCLKQRLQVFRRHHISSMEDDAPPPSYCTILSATSPPYSRVASQTESVVLVRPTRIGTQTHSPSIQQWLYKSDGIEVDLGQNIWNTHLPAFGLNGVVEGTVTLTCPLDQIVKLGITLEGQITTIISERGQVVGLSKLPLVSVTSEISYSANRVNIGRHHFSLPFPTYISGRSTILPPTANVYLPAATCEVSYRLRIELTRKGFRRHKSLKIPLLYLPKSYSIQEPVLAMPIVLVNPGAFRPNVPCREVKIVQLQPKWCTAAKQVLCRGIPDVFIATPHKLVYALNEPIPLAVKISSLEAPALAKLLAANLSLTLVHRTVLSTNEKRNVSMREAACGSAEAVAIHESVEGVIMIFYELRCPLRNARVSWQVDGVAEETNLIRARLSPPPKIANNLPKFEFEEIVRITTDSFDNQADGLGIPIPAIVLMPRIHAPELRLVMLAVATSFFSRTAISQSYNIGLPPNSLIRSSTPGPSGGNSTSSLPPPAYIPPFHIGPWRVQSASHKVTGKRVSVWSYDKKTAEADRSSAGVKERIIELLKAEASALGRLRHPNILEMVEPLEESRSELVFATELLISSLRLALPSSSRSSSLIELDEVEIQKGILQLCKGMGFLHTSARLIHSNLNLDSILINNSGDWKISGLGLTIPLTAIDGSATGWTSPMLDHHLPAYVQRSLDYIAPEYALDQQLSTASDMYSLGCIIYATHKKGEPPFRNHNNVNSLRENAGKSIPGTDLMDPDLRALLRTLITRHSHERPTPSTLPSYPFFSSLPISTLNFLDRSTFASKSREEKITFMKGLTGVLERFSEGLRTRKILPSLLEEMKDTHLLPYILPNIFLISNSLTPVQFASLVLPNLKPLFSVKEPPQNMLTLLENLELLQSKTEKAPFREHVLPLVYNALESEHPVVQERALKVVPNLCESIDYAEVQGVLFPRVALVFTKTRILSVKVATLETFLSMVKTLDQTSLTQKLVPLLSKIRTKEPAVMEKMGTLAVQEAMGLKVDREAVATLVLPQLWMMSMGPLLNVDQFQRFMAVINKLGNRVEREHNQHLRDSQRIEDRSVTNLNINGSFSGSRDAGSLNFESLVGCVNSTIKPDIMDGGIVQDDDVWGSILGTNIQSTPNAQNQTSPSSSSPKPPSLLPIYAASPDTMPSRMGDFNKTVTSTVSPSYGHVLSPKQVSSSLSQTSSLTPQPLAPPPTNSLPTKPNYNINLHSLSPPQSVPSVPALFNVSSPPLVPQRWSATDKKVTRTDLSDFDPLLK